MQHRNYIKNTEVPYFDHISRRYFSIPLRLNNKSDFAGHFKLLLNMQYISYITDICIMQRISIHVVSKSQPRCILNLYTYTNQLPLKPRTRLEFQEKYIYPK